MTTSFKFHTHDPGTFRYKNIVYIRTDKCGGTYFENIFKTFGFEKIYQDQINENDKIFTFIINPTHRRVKAITQLMYNTQTQALLQNKNFLRFIENITIGDAHNYPYFLQYEPFIDRTVFMPLDHANITAEQMLSKYFEIHCPELADKQFTNKDLYANKADKTKNDIYKLVSDNLKPFFFETVLQQDFDLYKQTIESVDRDLSQHLSAKYDK